MNNFPSTPEGPRHHQHEDILRFVQHAPDDIGWTIDKTECDDLLALKKDSAPGPDGIPPRCLQMCWWPWFEVPLSCLSSRIGGKCRS